MNFESPCTSIDTTYVTQNHVACNSFTFGLMETPIHPTTIQQRIQKPCQIVQ